ncbi:MAG: 30S ribosomal protein S4 [Candidatus Diapherotrites archaeon]|nr:30S ribosomal protein S4 [Candidatus Diapherotrites archaeon]
MGDPKRAERQYEIPRKHWDLAIIENERKTMETYGLKNKRELHHLQAIVKTKRHNARSLLALSAEQRVKRQSELLKSLERIGLLPEHATLDDVLVLSIEELLERRLQTVVWRKGLANTIGQARQFIVHGHIAVNGRKIDRPGYIVSKGEEEKVAYYGKQMQLAAKEKVEEIKKGQDAEAQGTEEAEAASGETAEEAINMEEAS